MNANWLSKTEAILDVAQTIVVILMPCGTLEYINKYGCDLLEYEREEMIGKDWFEHFVPAEIRPEAAKRFQQLIHKEPGTKEVVEDFVLTKSGTLRHIEWNTTRIHGPTGESIGVVSSGIDNTGKVILLNRLAEQEIQKRTQLVAAVIEAQEKERFFIANELHDNINQILTTCKLLLEQEMQTNADSSFVNTSYRHLQTAINEIRTISHRLNPVQLTEIGLISSVQDIIYKINLSSKIKVTSNVKGKNFIDAYPSDLILSIFRIIQEGLTNIIKYANATEAIVFMEGSATSFDLEIADNGKGFDRSKIKRGLGLKNMYSRVEHHQGSLYLHTAPGEGCLISVCIPVEPRAQSQE